jgi:hypothetical protein
MSGLNLFADVFEQRHQRRVGGNGLPFAHDTLRVNDFTGQHGAAVHGELQDVNHLFAAIHFHVRACGHKVSTALRLLRGFVIEQTPERPNIARLFDVGVVNVNRARIVSEHFLPLSMRSMGRKEQQQTGKHSGCRLQSVRQSVLRELTFLRRGFGIHAPYYKVVS